MIGTTANLQGFLCSLLDEVAKTLSFLYISPKLLKRRNFNTIFNSVNVGVITRGNMQSVGRPV